MTYFFFIKKQYRRLVNFLLTIIRFSQTVTTFRERTMYKVEKKTFLKLLQCIQLVFEFDYQIIGNTCILQYWKLNCMRNSNYLLNFIRKFRTNYYHVEWLKIKLKSQLKVFNKKKKNWISRMFYTDLRIWVLLKNIGKYWYIGLK